MNSVPEPQTTHEQAHFVFDEWDRRARTLDVAGLLNLYTEDATLESPLVPRILDRASGVLRGKVELGQFFTEGGWRRPNQLVRWHRTGGYQWDGRILSWEYLRATPEGDQVDISEVLELTAGRIGAHRIYWGWFGTEMLIDSAVHKVDSGGYPTVRPARSSDASASAAMSATNSAAGSTSVIRSIASPVQAGTAGRSPCSAAAR